MSLARIRVVLVRPCHPGNVGATARAMKNMGLADLVIVAETALDVRAAATMAVHAADVLDRHRRVIGLDDAIGDCGLVIAVSGRSGGAEASTARALAPTIVAATDANDVALVFGPEDHGLTNDELMRCQHVVTIPTAAAYPSLNLAQAVLLCAYELRLASELRPAADARADVATSPTASRERATAAEGERMYGALEHALRAIGFLHRDNGIHMMRALRGIFGRSGLDSHETRIVLAMARQIDWAAHAHRDVDHETVSGIIGRDVNEGGYSDDEICHDRAPAALARRRDRL